MSIRLITSFFFLLVSLICPKVQSARYIPLSLEKQFEESSGIIRGRFIGSYSKKNHKGQVVTVSSFHVKESAGIPQGDLLNSKDFKVLSPGGEWQGVVHQVPGAPTFSAEKDVIILVKKTSFGYVFSNLGLGKYNIINDERREFISSDVFPEHAKLGKIKLEEFKQLAQEAFGHPLEKIQVTSFISDQVNPKGKTKAKGRAPASLAEEQANNKSSDKFNILWLVAIFGCLGGISIFLIRSNR